MLLKEKTIIPNKSVFNVQEVCSLVGIKSYVLRFWETEFEQISPIVSSTGQKNFERKDIEVVGLIKKLLFEDKLSIEKAKYEVDQIYSGLIVGESFVSGNLQENQTEALTPEISTLLEESIIVPQVEVNEAPGISMDFEKLDLAKNSLFDILGKVDDIKSKYHWS